jgi:hypothetical protein
MNNIDYMHSLLQEYNNKKITVHLQRGGSDVVYTGTLSNLSDTCWKMSVDRSLFMNPQTRNPQVLPKMEVIFFTADVWYISNILETPEEAMKAIRKEASGIVTPSDSMIQVGV